MKERILLFLLTFIFGVLVNHLWDRFKRRITVLKYTVWHQPLGTSIEDERFGSVKILYNDKPAKNLYLSKLILTNESNIDLSELELNIVCDSSSMIIISHGWKKGNSKPLAFTSEYGELLAKQEAEDLQYLVKRRDYILHVLNRYEQAEFDLLTTNEKNVQPFITLSCDHSGVKVQYATVPPQLLFGESQLQCALIGTFIALLLSCTIYFISNKIIAIFLAVSMGLFASLFGVVLIKFYKRIIKILS